jgi:hypothetical protein
VILDALKYLVGLGRAEAPAIIHPAGAEPSHVYYIRDGVGLKKVEAEPPPCCRQPASIAALVEMVKDAVAAESPATVFYGFDQVTALLGEDGRDRVQMKLQPSDPYTRLCAWKSNMPALTQADLLRELRITFRDCLAPAGNLVELLRRVKFDVTSAGQAEVGHGKSSLGKQLTAELTGTGTLPEYVTLLIPIYANPCLRSVRSRVECAIEIDPHTQTFKLIPMPGQLQDAAEFAAGEIGRQLREGLKDADAPVYHGIP